MANSTKPSPPKLHNDALSSFNVVTSGRNYGIALGVLTAAYLIIINLIFGNGGEEEIGVPLGIRFAKHLLIIPVLWIAVGAFAKTMQEGHVFKGGLELVLRVAIWTAATLGALNLVFYILTSSSFEQFMNEGETFMDATLNSGLLLFETVVFVMIIGFIILQGLKGKGSPED